MKIELDLVEPVQDASPDEIAKIILARFGLNPKKSDGTAKMHQLLLELSERKKESNKQKKPELAVMTVEEMGMFAGIKRQTMYDYLSRWLVINLLKKTSFVSDGKIITGYELNGSNLESAFKKAEFVIRGHLEQSLDMVRQLQNEVKREKLKSGSIAEN